MLPLEQKCLLLSCALVYLCLCFGFPKPEGRTRWGSLSSGIALFRQGVRMLLQQGMRHSGWLRCGDRSCYNKAAFQHLWYFRRPPAPRPDVQILAQTAVALFSPHYTSRCHGKRHLECSASTSVTT